ncbi:MAG: ankyrin repeat domain-containing protein [Gammaproteobacteria bacterium WSBS_2016_MAG_OTU1]
MKNTFIALLTIVLLVVSPVAFAAECPLCVAAENGNLSEVKRLLHNDVDVNDENKNGWTDLMGAAGEGYREVAKLSLDKGANVNDENKNGWTALMGAAGEGHREVVKLLLDKGADVNHESKNGWRIGWTALMHAAWNGQSEVAKLLLENGANVNDKNEDGETALMGAAVSGQSEVAKVLLNNGANGGMALIWAAKRGHNKAVEILLDNSRVRPYRRVNVNYKDEDGWTALMFAARQGENEITKLLLDNGAYVDGKSKDGLTALMLAVYNSENEAAKVLLACGANPDIKDTAGSNAWKIAKDKPILFAILTKHLNDVVNGRKFPPCDKVATNKQNPTQPEVAGGIEADKLPKEHNIAERVFENTWRSVVYVDTYDAQGSGVIIRPNLVATNCHVVESANNIQVYKAEERRTNRDGVSYNATIIKQDEANDFCLLSVDGLWGIPATIRKYNTINIGEDVYGLGAPKGLDLSLSTGVVSQLRKDDEQRLIQTDTAISPGSSGGGLFDSEGNLIGILTEKIVDEDAEGLGFAIPADLAL